MTTSLSQQPDFVSTGQLPLDAAVEELVLRAYDLFAPDTDGHNSTVYPALERVHSNLFGIHLTSTYGRVTGAGDFDHPFVIMSVSKPFIFALICESIGTDEALAKLGANSTGLPFNSLAAIERSPNGHTNPMVNSGAIATTSLVQGNNALDKWRFIESGLSRFAGRDLSLNEEVYDSASATNFQNRAISTFLQSRNSIYCDPVEALDLYTRQCSLNVTARDLSTMGATLAAGGVNPITRERIVSPAVCHCALATMATAGLYETSGEWLYNVGLPGKSGIGGGMVTVSPGKGGLGTFAPPLDSVGNSVKGQYVAKFLSQKLGLNLFVSSPQV